MTDFKEIRFVGGPWDGRRITLPLPLPPYFYVPAAHPEFVPQCLPDDAMFDGSPMPSETYRLEGLTDGSYFYLHAMTRCEPDTPVLPPEIPTEPVEPRPRFPQLVALLLVAEHGKTEAEAAALVKKYPNVMINGIMGGMNVYATAMALLMMEERELSPKEPQ